MRVVRLRFHRGLRAGAPGWGLEQDEEFLRADTLYSALTLAALELRGRPLPPLRLTSAFPFANGEYYFPRPMLRHPMLEHSGVRARYGWLVRELRLLNLEDFRAWLAGRDVDLEAAARREEALRQKIGKVLRSRVALDRPRQNSALYFVTERRFAPEAGLFCLVDCAPEDWPAVEAAFRYLGDAGVGGERGAGLGRFEPEFGELDLPPAQDGMRCVTLAPVIPAPGEEKHLESYRLLERGGWVYSPATGRTARKKRVAAVAEGSVFARPVKGSRPDVAPSGWPHPVWRYGLGFFVRVG